MLKARLIGVVTVKEGLAVQSFGFNKYLPLGDPVRLIENLDRWGADEIYVQVIDRSKNNIGPDYALIDRISKLSISTPLIYGGGIHSVSDGIQVIKMGADRLALNAVLTESLVNVRSLSEQLGAQALLGVLPVRVNNNRLEYYDYRRGLVEEYSFEKLLEPLEAFVSEVMLVDYVNEGFAGKFDHNIIRHIDLLKMPVLLFGGISEAEQIEKMLVDPRVAGFGIGNFLNYRENSVQLYKESLKSSRIRCHLS